MVEHSVNFGNAYATPVCTPSRVSFLAGVNAAHHRVNALFSGARTMGHRLMNHTPNHEPYTT
nr:hypothetical protein [Sphingobacterium puteale]